MCECRYIYVSKVLKLGDDGLVVKSHSGDAGVIIEKVGNLYPKQFIFCNLFSVCSRAFGSSLRQQRGEGVGFIGIRK